MVTSMQKPPYELIPLRAGVKQAQGNIAAFEAAIAKERTRIAEYEEHIKAWEAYNLALKEA